MSKKRVLITGATGYLSHLLLDRFEERYELVLIDCQASSVHRNIDGVHVVDLMDRNVDNYRHLFRGVDTVIHNAFYRTPGHISIGPKQWLDDQPPNLVDGYFPERDNLDMAFNVYKLSLEEGVRRVIVTSSNHATDWYETKLHTGELDMVGPETFPLSNNFYGWAKASYEHMGFLFATGRFGRKLENIQVRIGGPRPFQGEKHKDNPTTFRRELGAYLSERDFVQLYEKSVDASRIENNDGIPYQIFYGISANTRSFWSIANARAVIGYEPQDDSELLYADDIKRYLNTPGRTVKPTKKTPQVGG